MDRKSLHSGGRHLPGIGKPTNPEYLLKPNELLEAFAPHLAAIAFEHGLVREPRLKFVQRLAACGQAHPWVEKAPFPLAAGH